jgi:hypothetical protein
MAETLSMAQPETVTVPEMAEFAVGASMSTIGGGPPATITETEAELVNGVLSVSAAVTVIV